MKYNNQIDERIALYSEDAIDIISSEINNKFFKDKSYMKNFAIVSLFVDEKILHKFLEDIKDVRNNKFDLDEFSKKYNTANYDNEFKN